MTDIRPDMLVVLDEHPHSLGALAIASRHADATVLLRSWQAPAPESHTSIVDSRSAEPTLDEALACAAERRIPWVALRRDLLDPVSLLGELLVAAGRQNHDDIPGFAVFLASGQPAPFQRMLAVVDRSSGPISGLMVHAAVSVAATAGAQLDVLVIGAEGEQISSDDELATLAISRERDLYEEALRQAAARRVRVCWIAAGEVSDPWAVVADQLTKHPYDLVVDDLGDVTVGTSRVLGQPASNSFAPGTSGEIPLRLLMETELTVLLVIDEIRLGIAPASLLRAGAVAAITLGMMSGGVVMVLGPSVAAEQVDQTAEARGVTRRLEESLAEGEEALAEGEQALSEGEEDQPEAQADAEQDQDAEAQPGPPEVEAPEGGASPDDVIEANEAAAESKQDLAEAEEDLESAQDDLADATEDVAEAETAAQAALEDLRLAEEQLREATLSMGPGSVQGAGLNADIPVEPTPEDVVAAQDRVAEAEADLQAAIDAGKDAVGELDAATDALAEAQTELTSAQQAEQAAAAQHAADKERAAVYSESLAESRAVPVDGDYELTAHFGDSGGNWSSGYHTGLDFAAPAGTDVVAAADGEVVSAGWEGAYGYQVVIEHEDGYQTTYSHLSTIRVDVGDEVDAGDHIGDVGNTGNTTGSHLHFEVLKDGKYIDPEYWLGW